MLQPENLLQNSFKDWVIATILDRHHEISAYGVKSIAIFGSVARDEARVDSDVDLLAEFEEVLTFDRYMDLKFDLEEWLGRRVDLVSHKMLNPIIREAVRKEAIYVT